MSPHRISASAGDCGSTIPTAPALLRAKRANKRRAHQAGRDAHLTLSKAQLEGSVSPGGAAAVEMALMIAKANTGRYKTASFWDSYHGRSAGALSVSGAPRDKSPRLGPLMPGAFQCRRFTGMRGSHGRPKKIYLQALKGPSLRCVKLFEYERDIAALIAEPTPKWTVFSSSGILASK